MYQCDQLPSLSRCRVGLNKKKEAKNSNVKPYWPRFIRLIYRIISVVRFYRRLSGVRLKCQNLIPGFQLFLRPSTRVIQTAVGSAEGSDQSINKSSSGKLVPLQTGIRNRSFIFESWHPQADGRLPQPQGTFWFLAAFVFIPALSCFMIRASRHSNLTRGHCIRTLCAWNCQRACFLSRHQGECVFIITVMSTWMERKRKDGHRPPTPSDALIWCIKKQKNNYCASGYPLKECWKNTKDNIDSFPFCLRWKGTKKTTQNPLRFAKESPPLVRALDISLEDFGNNSWRILRWFQ